ncbi:MAG: ribonuclease III [Pseudomonadota bacterium]|uniref:ribonuclease III n=1 Tax=Sulfuricystis thermophila TaxID=2496847 RepID=UPI0010369B99|nr:ribonuclease III [Sulfuricystis thermophila]
MSARLEQALGHRFDKPELLRQALTHRSHSSPHNERFEFLGDSVLNCAVALLLFRKFPTLKEGELSRLRASLVRQETLAQIATGLGLGDALRLGEGELKSGGFRRPSILADALEAIFGAICLDAGFDAALTTIERLYRERIERIDPHSAGKDAKTALQEWLQGRRLPLPHYQLLETHGNAHAQEFVVACNIPALDVCVTGRGSSRRAAEQEAAQAALARLSGA